MATISELMEKLDCTEEEAKDIIETDKAIDRGQRVYFDLSPEEEKAAKKMANVKGHTVYNFTKRERKPNEDKREIIDAIKKGLVLLPETGISTTINVTNAERELEFTYNGKKYKITLSAPRK